MEAQSTIEETISTGIGIMFVIVIIYIFYTTPSPIQQYFQNFVDSIIIGIILVIILVVLWWFITGSRESNRL